MERWYWIELIGFDNEASDYGVDSFLSRNVSTTGVSLLFSHIDFLFEQENETFSPTSCSYGGHEYNRERRRQAWTPEQLCGLVSALQGRGVKVFFSCFDMTKKITDTDWLCLRKDGKAGHVIYPIKPLGDRTVGDEILDRIIKVLHRYGFDGLHMADGISSNRRTVFDGDFSLSLCAECKIDIPKELMREGDDAYIKRRQWILENAQAEWTRYIADRWAVFYDNVFKRINKPVIFNNAWTRDSFEALYRYGLDYRKCHVDKAFAVMVEENSAVRAITDACDEGDVEHSLHHRNIFTYEYALMQQNIRLFTGGLKQISLTPISDTLEQWDALRHCPTELMRSIVRRYNNFVYRKGGFEVCSDAPMYCLSDGIPSSDWEWLASVESYRIPLPDHVCGFAAVINPDAIYSELEAFCKARHYFGSALLNELALGGLNIGASLSLSETENFSAADCLVVTDLNAYTGDQKQLLIKAKLPLLVIGEDVELPLECSARYSGEYISVALYNAKGISPDLHGLKELDSVIEYAPSKHNEIWTESLSCKRVDEKFFIALCRVLNTEFSSDYCDDIDTKVFSFSKGRDRYVILSNDKHTYNVCTVNTSSKIESAEALMKYKGYKVGFDSNSFTVRIPPRCIEIVKLQTEN